MKIFNKFKVLLLGVLSIPLLNSCEDDTILTIKEENQPVVLSLDINTIELDKTNPNNPALTFTWNKSSYSQPVVIDYILEFSLNQNMTNPVQVGFGNSNYITYSMKELNSKVAEAGVFPFTLTTVYARVTSSIGSQHDLKMQSNVVSFSVKSYYAYPFKDIFLVGPASASGWDNNNTNAVMFRNSSNPKQFSYVGKFNEGMLKMLEKRGKWTPQYGATSPGLLAYRPIDSDPDPSPIMDLVGGTAGYYNFSIDIAALTYSITPYSITGINPATSVSMSGSALASSQVMTQYTVGGNIFDTHIWKVSSVHLVPGNFNFVLNGTNNWGSTTSFSGTATNGGGQIPVIVEDDYEVWFNDLTGQYHLIPINISQT